MPGGPVPHTVRCRLRDDSTCESCRREAYLDQFPASQHESQGKLYDRRRAALPRPLSASVRERLAADMVEHREFWSPVLRHVLEDLAPEF